MQEMQVRYLGREDPVEKGMASHTSIPAWKIPWTEEPGRLQSMRLHTRTELSMHVRGFTYWAYLLNMCCVPGSGLSAGG